MGFNQIFFFPAPTFLNCKNNTVRHECAILTACYSALRKAIVSTPSAKSVMAGR